ncbi:CaiB/BaiF CoA transferase family protein [Thermodesulfobacteriota bacterium]
MEHAKDNMQPLDGYRVLDFGTAWAGPMAGHLLADTGAEVIKVETRNKIDGNRLGRPIVGKEIAGDDKSKWVDMQPAFHALNRNKLSITIDLKNPVGQKIIKELIKISDVVIDNSSPGVMKKLGLDHDSLEAIKPDIITLSLTACGENGPLRDAVAYAPAITAIGGLNSLLGYRDQEDPYLMNLAYGDASASIHGTLAILASLWHREETGEGQHIELSESEAVTSLLGEGFMEYIMNGRVLGPQGNYHKSMCPHGVYRCKGEDKWVAIAINTEDEWRSFCNATGSKHWLREEKFSDRKNRLNNQTELDNLISGWTKDRTPREVMEMLQKAGVAATIVMNVENQFADPHYKERKTFEEVEHPMIGKELIHGIPWRMSKTPGRIERSAPSLGEHNEYVFGQLLGYSMTEIKRLEKEKVLY